MTDAAPPTGRAAIFTIVSANYIAFAATLMQSVRQHHPDVARYIVLSDAMYSFDDLDLAAELVACDDLGIDLLGNMKLWYSVIEFNTAVKPFTFRHMFAERGFDRAVYIDPDIQLFAPLTEVFGALADHSLVLTPHMTKPLQDGKQPDDIAIMKSGVYNFGFVAVADDPDGRNLVQWWCDRLFAHCRVDIPGNMFTDQRWMDLSPVFVERPFILRHPGYNAAYWNIVHRTIEQDASGTWRSNGQPLVFFHFSGITPEDPTVFSKHQNRFTIETLGQVARLCDQYRERVLANGWLTHNRIPYGYAKFNDGRPITDGMRRWILRALDAGRLPADRPLRISSVFFDAADDETFAGGGQLTRFAHQLWLDRVDLKAAFNINTEDGFNSYVAWLCDGEQDRPDVPAAMVQAAQRLRDGSVGLPSYTPPRPCPPPWTPLSQQSWNGPANEVGTWLTGDVHFSIGAIHMRLPGEAALLWERRIDLQQYFPLQTHSNVEQYHCWALTDGMLEQSISGEFFSADYLAWLDAPSAVDQLYEEVPVTNGMVLTRRSAYARDGMHSWSMFPLQSAARLEQAFWFAYVAPAKFDWPLAMTASVRRALDMPSSVTLEGYPFSRGMMAIHAMRADVQATFPLDSEADRWDYLCWLIAQGASEYKIDPAALCPGLPGFLATSSPRTPQMSRLAMFAYHQREDLRAAFNLNDPADVDGMCSWVTGELEAWLLECNLITLVPAPASSARLPVSIQARVALSGDWNAASGIGEDVRTSAAALDACGFTDYVVVNLATQSASRPDGTMIPPGTAIIVDWNIVHHNADTTVSDWQVMRRLGLKAARSVGHWAWELERLPSYWRHAYGFYDEIWAASRFAAKAFEAEKLRPVRLLNMVVSVPSTTQALSRRRFGVPDVSTLFLFIFDWASHVTRKNPDAVVRAFALAFPNGDEPVHLLIKTHNAALRPDLWAALESRLHDPRIILRDENLSRDDLAGLIKMADAFVSLHRSEGYGRLPAEAMLLEKPVIVTSYSGTMEFTTTETACLVGCTLVPVGATEYPGVEHQRWAEADVADAARQMRWVFENPGPALAMARRGRALIEERLSPEPIGQAILAAIETMPAAQLPTGGIVGGSSKPVAQSL